MSNIQKIVIFSGALNYSVRKGIATINKTLPEADIRIFLHQPPRPLSKLVRNQWVNLKRNGWRWIPYQQMEILRLIFTGSGTNVVFADRIPGQNFEYDTLLANPKISLIPTVDINSAATASLISTFAPDLGISLAAPILKPDVFELPKLGTINLHKGKLPDYRGMPPAFWELWNDEKSVGCSVHKVSEKLDAGKLIATTAIDRQAYSTLKGLQLSLDETGIGLMVEAVTKLAAGELILMPQQPGGQTFRKPTLRQQAQLHRKINQGCSNGIKPLIKDAVFSAYSNILRAAPRLIRSINSDQRVVILMYHRVNDELQDGVTVGIESFDWQMQYLRKHYPVVSVDNLVKGEYPKNSRRPLIAVTFDDGYRDNYEHAAPILLKHGVPATFFVSTGLMGTDQGFQHDLTKLGRPLRNMNWDQIREMTEMGFDIGSHTVNHINCGKNNSNAVKRELVESKEMLQRELGLDKVLFAYPFGGRDDIVPEVLSYVKEIGYECCMSAYGGVNTARQLDIFNMLRTGINFNFSRQAFIARLEGLT